MPLVLPAPPELSSKSSDDVLAIHNYTVKVYRALQERTDIQAVGMSVDSPFQRITLPATAATPATPTGLTAFGFYKQIFLVWNYDPNPAIGSWEVSRSSSSGGTYTVLTNSLTFSFLDTDLDNSVTWHYKVRAVLTNGSTFSALTASVNATTMANDSGVMALLPTAATAVQAAATL